MGARKSVKRPRSDRGNGPGGSKGRIPLGISAMLAIAIVHEPSQRIVSDMSLSSNELLNHSRRIALEWPFVVRRGVKARLLAGKIRNPCSCTL